MKVSSTLVIFSILLTALSGLTAIASAEDRPPVPNMFYGTASLDGEWAQPGTVIGAYIDGELHGSVEITTKAWYGSLAVNGSDSDDGKTITFKVGGLDADQTAVWHARLTPTKPTMLNLSTGPAPTTPAPGSGGGSGGSGLPTTTSTDENASAVSEETESASTSSTTEPATPAAETTTTPEEPGAESDDDSGFLSGFGMILAVIVVAGIIVAVYLVSKRS